MKLSTPNIQLILEVIYFFAFDTTTYMFNVIMLTKWNSFVLNQGFEDNKKYYAKS